MIKRVLFFILSLQSFSAYSQIRTDAGQIILINPNTVSSINTVESIRVPVGTAFGSINFSDYGRDYVSAYMGTGIFQYVTVSWAIGSYNSATPGTYTLSGTMQGVTNPLGLTPTIDVEVVALETEYQAILTEGTTQGYTLPTPINQGDQNRLVKRLKTSSLWTTADFIYNWETDGSSSFALMDWKNPTTRKATTVSSPTYTTRRGFTFNGTSSYINSQWNVSTATNFTQNNCSFGGYLYDAPTSGTVMGVVASGARLTLSRGQNLLGYEITGNTNPTIADGYGAGWYHIYRSASGSVNAGKNAGTLVTGVTDASVARPNANLYIGCRNNNGTPDSFADGTVSYVFGGASFSASVKEMHDAFQEYHLSARVKNIWSAPAAIGVVLNDNFARATLGNNYVVQGAATFSPDGTKLVQSGGAPGTHTNRLAFKYGQSCENCTLTFTATSTVAPGAATGGTGITFSDYSGCNGERTIETRFDYTNGGNAGKCFINTWDGSTAVTVATSSGAIGSLASGNTYNITVTKSIVSGLVSYTITVVRTSDSASSTVTYSALLGDSSGDFAIGAFGGTFNITNWTITVNSLKNQRLCVVGESREHGAFATTLDSRYASKLYSPSYEVSAGSGDCSADVIGSSVTIAGKIKSLIDYNAMYYYIGLLSNDISGGIATGTWQNNITRIINALKNAGYKVILATPAPRNDGDQSAAMTFYNANFSDPKTTAVYDALRRPGDFKLKTIYDYGDGIHLNNLGMITGGNAGSLSLPILYLP